ncbi:MAG: hypothetical protein WD270_01655 [Acetobacterales bacterium]
MTGSEPGNMAGRAHRLPDAAGPVRPARHDAAPDARADKPEARYLND